MSSYRPQEWQPEETAPAPQMSMPPAIKVLLILNGSVFALQVLLGAFTNFSFVRYGGLSPLMVANGAVWQLVTYMFLHGDFLHILLNMLALWMFGRDLEYGWGTKEFIRYYFVCGVGAAIFSLVFLWNSPSVIIGASGAVFGVLLAYAMAYPNREIIFIIFPIKAKYLVLFLGGATLITTITSAKTGVTDGVAHLTHLGGLAIGFFYLKFSDTRFLFPRPLAWLGRWRAQRKGRELRRRFDEHRELMEEVDRILDRINQVGYEGLTPEERDSLERASKRLSTEPQK